MSQVSAYAVVQPPDARPAKTHLLHNYIKRIVDISLSLPLLILAALVIAIMAIIVRFDGGQAFFGQERVGQNGRLFTCWKLRTMCRNAEAHLDAYLKANPAAYDEWQEHRKLTNDPRITRLGRFLRRSSLDELPQLWNVLRGDMSLVGPRPVILDELDLYGVFRNYYIALRPGLTGKWQISGRNATTYSDRIALDVAYATQHNLLQDIAILVRTIFVVLRMTGR